jgi:hypothetical protein
MRNFLRFAAGLLYGVALMAPVLAMMAPVAWGQENKLDLPALVKETQITTQRERQVTLVWWIPEDFFRLSMAQNPNVSAAQAGEFIEQISPYIMVAVLDGNVGPAGSVTYRSESEIRAALKVVDAKGNRYQPLAEDAISNQARLFVTIMRPIMANMLGPMGQNVQFYLFAASDADGQPICNARKEGSLVITLGEREFKWKLPLNSLFAPVTCTKCKSACSGAWKFCPWCGTALPAAAPVLAPARSAPRGSAPPAKYKEPTLPKPRAP